MTRKKRYSAPQRYDIFPNRYRIKDYLTKEWHYIENSPPHFGEYKYTVMNKCFKTLLHMNCFLSKEKL